MQKQPTHPPIHHLNHRPTFSPTIIEHKKGYRLDKFSTSSQTIVTRLHLIKKDILWSKTKAESNQIMTVTYNSSFPLRVHHAAKSLFSEEEGVLKKQIHGFPTIPILKWDNSLETLIKTASRVTSNSPSLLSFFHFVWMTMTWKYVILYKI